MYIPQCLLKSVRDLIQPGKVVILFGPRRTGKTTLLQHYLEDKKDYLLVSGDDLFVHEYLSSQSIEKLKGLVGSVKLLVIDEAQKIDNIGLNLKLLIDHMPDLAIIATGSSTFDLARQVGEPLTGRKKVLKLFPLSQLELGPLETVVETRAHLEGRLIYGSYPEIVLLKSDEEKRS